MGTVTVRKADSKLNGKIGEVFYRFDDGRVNARFSQSVMEGSDVITLTLKPHEFVCNEEHLVNLDKAILEALS